MKILMVCLGNICRSPMAEGIMRNKVEKYGIGDVFIDSAGTSNYHIGEHPDNRAVKNLRSHDIDISTLSARQFEVNDFDRFDLIFAMDSSNYGDIISMARHESDRKKVSMILNMLNPESNQSVPDPYYGGIQGFENVFILLDEACEMIIKSLIKIN